MVACLAIEAVPVSHVLTKFAVSCALASTLVAPTSSSAQTFPNFDPRCEAVYKFSDGSWINKVPLIFGRKLRIDVGTTIYRGTVIDGIDLGRRS